MCDQISAWNGPWFAERVEQYIVERLETALDVNEEGRQLEQLHKGNPEKLYTAWPPV